MPHRATLRTLALLAAGAAMGALAVASSSAGANTPPRHVTTVGHLSLDSSAFVPDGIHNSATDYFNTWDPATLSNQDSGRCFDAAVNLPPNASLKHVTIYYTQGSQTLYAELNRQTLATHTDATLFSVTTTTVVTPAYTSVTRSIAPKYALVTNLLYAYSLGVCISASTTFTAAVLTYTTTT
jgi:hypothetical protein